MNLCCTDTLQEEYPFHTVPPLPEKNALKRMDRFKPEYLERRRIALEKFMNRVARHPVHTRSPEFVTFCQAAQGEVYVYLFVVHVMEAVAFLILSRSRSLSLYQSP